MEFYEGYTPEQCLSIANSRATLYRYHHRLAHHQVIPPNFLRFPSSSFIYMEFCTDPQGRQAKAPEQRYSVATFPQALLLLLWRAPMTGYLFFVENRTFLLCIDKTPVSLTLSLLIVILSSVLLSAEKQQI